jgi:hypothetical protein
MSKLHISRWTPSGTWTVWIILLMILTGGRNARAQDTSDTGDRPSVIIDQRAIRHIMERHWPDSPAPGAGKYAPGMTVDLLKQLVNETIANGRLRHNTNGRPGQIYEYDFGHPIGIKINGRPAYRLRAVVNDRNDLVTAFPF